MRRAESTEQSGAQKHWRAAAACSVALAALWAWAPAAVAGASKFPNGHTMSTEGCYDQANLVQVPIDRAEERVPEGYTVRPVEPDTPLEGEGATALLEVSELRCDRVTVSDTVLAGPVTIVLVGLDIDAPPGANHVPADNDTPDDFSDDAVLSDLYLLFLATDSRKLADWWRAGTGLEAHHVPGIVYDYAIPEPFGVAPFFFEAPAPPDWAFRVVGAAPAQNESRVFIDVNFWRDTKTPDGKTWRVKLGFPYHGDYVAPAAVTVTAAPGSELEKLLVTNPATPTVAVGAKQDPWTGTKTVTSRK